MEPDSVTALFANLNDHEYPATCIIANGLGNDTVLLAAISLRGNTSLTAAKKSIKVSFNTFYPGRTYKRLEKLNLNGEHNDPSITRSKIYWETLASMKVPGARANHFEVYINGSYYGLYMNVEHMDENFIKSRFGNKEGNLYKCTYPADLAFISSNPNDYKLGSSRRVYELQTNLAADDYSDLAHFIQILNNSTTNQFRDSIESILNVNALLRAYATDISTGNWDDYFFNINNFYLYFNPETGKFEYLPYDTDNTFGIDWFNIDWKTRDLNNWIPATGNRALIRRLLTFPEYRDRLSFFIGQLLTRMGDTAVSFPRIDSIRNLISPFVLNDPFHSLDYGFTYQDFLNSFDQSWGAHVKDGIKPFIQGRQLASLSQVNAAPIPPLFSETRHVPRFPVAGDSVFIRTWIEDDGPLSNISLSYRWNSGSLQTSPFYDDGQHRDYLPNDGYYGAFAGVSLADTLYYFIEHTDVTGLTGREPRSGWKSAITTGIPFVKINEWMSSNTSTVADEAGEFDDWMELYNPLSNPQPWSRICISDTVSNPGKWELPDTLIGGNGFFLLWADEDKSQGPFHMNFKLSGIAGEELFVSYFNGESYRLLDSVSFGPMMADRSMGCLPDGVRPMVWQGLSTPGSSNLITGIIQPGLSSEPYLYPNPTTDRFKLANDEHIVGMEVRTVSGALHYASSSDSFVTDVSTWPGGLYIVVLKYKGGEARYIRLSVIR